MISTAATPLFTARFNPLIRPYLLWSVAFVLIVSVIGIVLLPIWLLGVGQWWSRHYFHKLECELTDRALRFKRGILFETEKTIPLENIQDVTLVEGPVLRHFDLCILKFETAGQSIGQAHDMRLIGVIDAPKLRNMILEQRQALINSRSHAAPATDTNALLTEIRDALRDIREVLQTQRNQPSA